MKTFKASRQFVQGPGNPLKLEGAPLHVENKTEITLDDAKLEDGVKPPKGHVEHPDVKVLISYGQLKEVVKAAAILLLALFCATSANAQVRGFDVFQNVDVIAVPGTNLIGGIIGPYTNQPIYVLGKDGGARMDFYAFTNAGVNGLMSVTVQGSPDLTNWSNLGSYGLITNYTSLVNSNHFYGGSLLATNQGLLPFTVTTPVPATAGFATSDNAPIQYTNSGSFALQPGYNSIGFSAQDCPKYLRVIWNPTGAVTNWTFGAELMTTIAR